MTNGSCRRRRFLYEAGVALTAGVLAGCTGNGGSGATQTAAETATDTGGTATTADTETTTEGESTTGMKTTDERTTAASPVTEPAPAAVDEYLSNANFYNGDLVVDVPFVAVGIPGPRTGFDPAAIRVPVGTEVTWEWANEEQRHSVLSIESRNGNRVLDSGTPEAGGQVTYRHTFKVPGIYRYYCPVHRAQTARGAVVVVPEDDAGGSGND